MDSGSDEDNSWSLGSTERVPRVYTVCDESRYLIVRNVPALGCVPDLIRLFALYGPIEEYRMLDEDEAAGPDWDTVWIKFQLVENARFARRKLHGHPFFASELKVTYSPEDETPEDTLAKLEERRTTFARRCARLAEEDAQDKKSSSTEVGVGASGSGPAARGRRMGGQQPWIGSGDSRARVQGQRILGQEPNLLQLHAPRATDIRELGEGTESEWSRPDGKRQRRNKT